MVGRLPLPSPRSAARALVAELHQPSRRPRAVWCGAGSAHVELLRRDVHDHAAAAVRALEGVDWAEVDEGLGRLLVAFDADAVDVADVVDAVAEVENAAAARPRPATEAPSTRAPSTEAPSAGGPRGQDRNGHPGDPGPVAAELVALGVDAAAFGFAVAGRLLRLPAVPRAAAAAVALVDHQPRARRAVERGLGRAGTDLAIGLANAGVAALSQSPDMILVGAAHRCATLGELLAARAAFTRLEPELGQATRGAHSAALGRLGEVARERRPRPLPAGPVERCADRMAAAGLALGAATLAVSGSPVLAGDLLLATVPRAARLGREVFAATAGRRLAGHDVLALERSCLRRLDRVDTVVVSPAALLSGTARVLSAPDGPSWTVVDALVDGLDVWRPFRPGAVVARDGAVRLVAAHARGTRRAADPDGLPVELRGTRPVVSGLVGVETDGHAEAVLRAARACGSVLLGEHVSTAEFTQLVDARVRGGTDLATEVWRAQARGAVVLVVGCGSDTDALHVADVGVGLVRPGERPPWCADLLCVRGLADVWRVLQYPVPARATSRRAASLAVSGSALSTLTTVVGGGASGRPGRSLAGALARGGPVSAAAVSSMAEGLVAASRADRRPPPAPVRRTDWHALDAEAVRRRLPAAPRDPAEPGGVRSDGAGAHPTVRSFGKGARELGAAVVADLRDPLVPVLMVGAAASAVLGSTVDAALVAGVSVTNAVLSGAQRARAEAAMRGLMARHLALARVETTGGLRVLPADELRPGDRILVRAGDVVPADARLLAADTLEVDEASLTGESVPVGKSVEPTPSADLADRSCMLFEGTTVLAGTGRGIVVAVGEATEAGRASAAVVGTAAPVGVQNRLGDLTRLALPLTAASGLAVAALSVLRGAGAREALGAGVAVAVAAVPEGLPLVATVAQVAAARRLARLGVLVRSSRTVEALGRIDTVCFDKTGTLTEGRLVLREVAVVGGASRDAVLRVAGAASPRPDGPIPHATDRAVLAAAEPLEPLGRRLAELPFETARGYAVTMVQAGDATVLAVKGAPETLLDRCRMPARDVTAAHRTVDALAARGLRVLAVARSKPFHPQSPAPPAQSAPPAPSVPPAQRAAVACGPVDIPDALVRDLELVGFVGLADTPRPTAAPAIRRLTGAGLRVLVVTGDHPGTAAAIAAEVGLPVTAGAVITGPELDQLGDEEFGRRVGTATVFARISPEQKVRLVMTLRRQGRTVAMTGDGTNDAAAIRAADVGVAVEGRGSAAATGAADLLLTTADVDRLADAVIEGRRMWQSVTDAVSVLVGGNAGEVAFTLLGAAVSGRAPLSPRQLLLVNLLTDMAPAMALAVRGRGGDPPHSADTILAGPLRRAILLRGATTAGAATAAWAVARRTGTPGRASTVALLAVVGSQLGQTLALAGRDPLVIATAAGSFVVLAGIVQTPVVSTLFGCRPVGPVGWTIAVVSASAATVVAVGSDRARRGRSAQPAADQPGDQQDEHRSDRLDDQTSEKLRHGPASFPAADGIAVTVSHHG
ncbi:ATPase, P-type (transporting), HAD superfamily, subfamily IC [Parafrankia sp. EAN1pec]|uniref:cation-translocating P-type ATPase n=1 Tax=Parafrankia sp. (strain EAN1pec) TaxID=298653 RepID=UPI00015D9C51|nr:ATPase, P-type (transporting), HAD superfamily, subfamily IC [Frankia sp. EAN1pec]